MARDYDCTTDMTLVPIKDHILVTDIEQGMAITAGGIIIPDADGKVEGIQPRWARVVSKGPTESDVEIGQWVLVEHGRWTRGVKDKTEQVLRMIENKAIIMTCNEDPRPNQFNVS